MRFFSSPWELWASYEQNTHGLQQFFGPPQIGRSINAVRAAGVHMQVDETGDHRRSITIA